MLRGYLLKSSYGPNWVGFTKIETMTTSHSLRALRISERCPSWSAPMVGTNPMDFLSSRAALTKVRIVETSEKVRIAHLLSRWGALIGVIRSGECAGPNFLDKAFCALRNRQPRLGISLCMAERLVRIQPEQIVEDLYLTVAIRSG